MKNLWLLSSSLLFSWAAIGYGACSERTDGAVNSGTRSISKSLSGEWRYDGNWESNGTYEFQIRRQFLLPNGSKGLVIQVSAPGYEDDCAFRTVKEADVILYEGHVCAEKK